MIQISRRRCRVGILVYEGFEPIDVWGFTEAFTISRFLGTGYQCAAIPVQGFVHLE